MKKIFYALIILLALSMPAAYCKESAEAIRDQAFNKVKVAQGLVVRAQRLLKLNAQTGNLTSAINIYAEAGKLFQEANEMLRSLGAQYVSPQDIEGCESAIQVCLDAITKCKERIRFLSKETKGLNK